MYDLGIYKTGKEIISKIENRSGIIYRIDWIE